MFTEETTMHNLGTATSQQRLRVLVVDDNVDAAITLSELLKLWGYEAWVVHNGLEAVRIALTHQPDVALLDIGLPLMDGYEVAQRIRQEFSLHRPILIAVTGYGQEEDRRRSLEAGFDYHFTKPVNLAVLRGVLASVKK